MEDIQQFRRFLSVGVANSLIDVLILNLLMFASGIYTGGYLIVFNTISYSAGTTNSFIMNKKWTFKDKNKNYSKQFIVFFIVSLIGMVINNAIIYGLITYMDPVFGLGWAIWVNFAKIIGIGVAVIWNYMGYKILVFEK